MKKFIMIVSVAILTAMFFVSTSQATAILTQSANVSGYGLNGSSSNMKALLEASHTLTVTPTLDNPAQLNNYVALWVNDRFSAMNSAEMTAITDYIGAGHKAVFITDNNSWASWNNSLETMLGANITDVCASSNGTPLVANNLTSGVSTLFGSSCNSLINQTPNAEILFSNNNKIVKPKLS